jgi:hypothetical protein
MKRFSAAFLLLTAMVVLSACADGDVDMGVAGREMGSDFGGPPVGYSKEQWISSNGCTYFRAQAPGYAPTWHLVVNGAQVGMTNAHDDCVVVYGEP